MSRVRCPAPRRRSRDPRHECTAGSDREGAQARRDNECARGGRGRGGGGRRSRHDGRRAAAAAHPDDPQFLLLVTIIAFSAFVTWQTPAYFEINNLTNIFRNAVFIFIIAAFSTYVLVGSGLDLSVGSVFLVGSIAVANLIFIGVPIWLSIIIAVALGALRGLANGVLIQYVEIPAFIATLGMLYVARGLATFVTGGRPIAPLPG